MKHVTRTQVLQLPVSRTWTRRREGHRAEQQAGLGSASATTTKAWLRSALAAGGWNDLVALDHVLSAGAKAFDVGPWLYDAMAESSQRLSDSEDIAKLLASRRSFGSSKIRAAPTRSSNARAKALWKSYATSAWWSAPLVDPGARTLSLLAVNAEVAQRATASLFIDAHQSVVTESTKNNTLSVRRVPFAVIRSSEALERLTAQRDQLDAIVVHSVPPDVEALTWLAGVRFALPAQLLVLELVVDEKMQLRTLLALKKYGLATGPVLSLRPRTSA